MKNKRGGVPLVESVVKRFFDLYVSSNKDINSERFLFLLSFLGLIVVYAYVFIQPVRDRNAYHLMVQSKAIAWKVQYLHSTYEVLM